MDFYYPIISGEIFHAIGLKLTHYDKYWILKAEYLKIPKDMNKIF